MITITFDKESEYQLVRLVIETGILNCGDSVKTLHEKYGVPLKLNVNYKASDNYEDDIPKDEKEKSE